LPCRHSRSRSGWVRWRPLAAISRSSPKSAPKGTRGQHAQSTCKGNSSIAAALHHTDPKATETQRNDSAHCQLRHFAGSAESRITARFNLDLL
jgi:hypothetical protein